MTEEDYTEDVDGSRRSFMKKGALASSAAALGLAGSSTVMGASNAQEGVGSGLVFSYDYHPGLPFQVVSSFQQPTVANILGGDQGVVNDPADYNGYIVRYQTGGGGIYALVFIRDQNLQQGTTYQFSGSASFFNVQINLLSAELTTTDGGGGGSANVSDPNL